MPVKEVEIVQHLQGQCALNKLHNSQPLMEDGKRKFDSNAVSFICKRDKTWCGAISQENDHQQDVVVGPR